MQRKYISIYYEYFFLAGGGSTGGSHFARGFNHDDFFTFKRAEDIFEEFFGGNPFANSNFGGFGNDDDFFGGGSFNKPFNSPFSNDFVMGGPFGKFSQFGQMNGQMNGFNNLRS